MTQAQQSGQPVLATAETTESSSVVANPDGTLTATLGAGPLQEPDEDSPTGWSPIDLSLQHEDGTFAPAVSAADTSFSDGGSGALATLADGQKTYTENWPTRLPVPKVSGEVATYPDVLPDVDLVMQATTAGFKQSFVLHSPPSQQLVLDVPLSLRGLTATVEGDGNLVVTDAHGDTVATSGTAVMYGAATGPTGEPAISEFVDTAIVNGQGGPVFQIRPDQAFFSNPDLTWPVSIDPSPNLEVTTDGYVRQSTPTTSYFTETGLKVGLVATGDLTRAMLKFPALDAAFRGNSNPIEVSSATLNLYETDAGSCTASETDLYEVTSSWIGGMGATWNTQPSVGTVYASGTFAAGHNGNCPASQEAISTGGANGHTLADLAQNWADGSTNNGIELRAANETATSAYKRFRASEYGSTPPILAVTYDTVPDVPDQTWAELGDELNPPVLHGRYADPDGGSGSVHYAVYDATETLIASGDGATVASGTDSALTLPAETFQAGASYTWTARADDGAGVSAWGPSNDGGVGVDQDTSKGEFIIECLFDHRLNDDPIAHPGQPGVSHSHDFFANPRTDAYSTQSNLESALVDIDHATKADEHTAEFYTAGGEVQTFVQGQDIYVEGTTDGYDGTWTVLSRIYTTRFTAHREQTINTESSMGGTAADPNLCGHPHGDLTYDTGAYWSPSVYKDGEAVDPSRVRVYYFGQTDPVATWPTACRWWAARRTLKTGRRTST